jgi:hypothetical protein
MIHKFPLGTKEAYPADGVESFKLLKERQMIKASDYLFEVFDDGDPGLLGGISVFIQPDTKEGTDQSLEIDELLPEGFGELMECTYEVGDRTVDEARKALIDIGMKEEDLGYAY